MAIRIDTVASRSKLKPRRDPYFQRVSAGVFVGYRKMASSSPGTWVIRLRDDDGKQHHKPLGTLEHLADFERFDHAQKEALDWRKHTQTGGIAEPKTVGEACTAYVKNLRSKGREKAALDAEKRFARFVTSTGFAKIELAKLTSAKVEAWRQALTETPLLRGTKGGKPSVVTQQKRSSATINRDMTALRAALNLAHKNEWVPSDAAWVSKLEAIPGAGGRRTVYLDRDQRQRLIEACVPSGLAPFVRVLAQLPVRPGALAALNVGHFDPRLNMLSIKVDKTEGREIKLPNQTAALFAEACRNKLPAAPIFTRPDGKRWDKDSWKDPFKAAALAAGLPADAVMYSLRHSAITDLSESGLPLLTVAQISGTSVKMIENHYGHLQADAATTALATLAM